MKEKAVGFSANTRFLLSDYNTASFYETAYLSSKKLPRIISYDRRSSTLQFGTMTLIMADMELHNQVEVEINSTVKVVCNEEQYFYLIGGTKITAVKLKPGMELFNLKTNTTTIVTAVSKPSMRQMIHTCSVARYGNYALSSGVVVKA